MSDSAGDIQFHFDYKPFLKSLTQSPGIYQMLGKDEKVLYVGKARNLQKRVASYFKVNQLSVKTASLMKQVYDVRIIVSQSDTEALLLESNVIKTLKPKYNVLFRDDKSFPYIRLTHKHDFPRLDFYRGKRKKDATYYGPYPSSVAVRETLLFLQKVFKLRQCNDIFFKNRKRPCLQYQIKRCTAPCVDYITKEAYQADVNLAIDFLEGKSDKIKKHLAASMEAYSKKKSYELAAKCRDQIAHLRHIQESQFASTQKGDVDIVVACTQAGIYLVHLLSIRQGRILGNRHYIPKQQGSVALGDVLSAFISQHYLYEENTRVMPAVIITNNEVNHHAWLSEALSQLTQKKIQIVHHVRGQRAQWLNTSVKTAQELLKNHLATKQNQFQRLEALQKCLSLPDIPRRIECFDISHSGGEETVASCVVFDTQGPKKTDYRRYNIKNIKGSDDYAAMHQALLRRYKHAKSEESTIPDVLLIDGGKGQLNEAINVLEELQISGIELIAISKGPGRKAGLEILHRPGSNPIDLQPSDPALHLLQQVRDEAHRFAITGHRKRRDIKRKTSRLESLPGVGPAKRRALLQYFGGLQEVKNASVAELRKVNGINDKLAQEIFDALR